MNLKEPGRCRYWPALKWCRRYIRLEELRKITKSPITITDLWAETRTWDFQNTNKNAIISSATSEFINMVFLMKDKDFELQKKHESNSKFWINFELLGSKYKIYYFRIPWIQFCTHKFTGKPFQAQLTHLEHKQDIFLYIYKNLQLLRKICHM
jgi:hypothetical protein